VSRRAAAAAAAIVLAIAVGRAQAPNPDPARFEKDIAAFEAADRASPPPAGGALFVGSSSIRYWDVAKAFPSLPTITRGYGGSHVSDTIHFAGRIVFPYRPRLIVFYAGDADVAANKTAEQIAGDELAFVSLVHATLPNTAIVIIGVKPSPAHWSRIETIRAANLRLKAMAAADPLLTYADVDAPLIAADGRPRPDFYADNGLNLNERGYQAWTAAVGPIVEAAWARVSR
jgi:lysophospholipase L1-like esterase